MEIQDKSLTCSDCGDAFVFTAGEQKFFQEKGFGHEPRRCKDCRSRKKGDGPSAGAGGGARHGTARHSSRNGGGGGGGNSDKQFYSAVCSACGGPAKLTFQPSPDRPVFCRTCFQARQAERSYR